MLKLRNKWFEASRKYKAFNKPNEFVNDVVITRAHARNAHAHALSNTLSKSDTKQEESDEQ